MFLKHASLLFVFLILAACEQPISSPRVARPAGDPHTGSPPIVHCFDGIEHIKGTYPYILGGTCVHSPTQEILDAYHRDGFLKDYNLERLKQLYKDRGIKTIDDHKECNNYCPWGPHVVKGGHCMVPPTPGTKNYEEVLSGWYKVEPAKK